MSFFLVYNIRFLRLLSRLSLDFSSMTKMCFSSFICFYFVWGILSFGGFSEVTSSDIFLSFLSWGSDYCAALYCYAWFWILFIFHPSLSFVHILLYSHSLHMAEEHINLFNQFSEFILVNVLFVSLFILRYLFTPWYLTVLQFLDHIFKILWNIYGSCFKTC